MNFQTSKKERIGYYLFCLGFPIFGCISGYINRFMTDSGIPAAIVAVILGIAQVWDGVNDPAFGSIVDLKLFKSGKYKPWVTIAPILLPAIVIVLFLMPNSLSLTAKIIWAGVLYILCTTAADCGDIPVFGVVSTMSSDVNERNHLIGRRSLVLTITMLLGAILIPVLFPIIGWSWTAIIVALYGGIFMFPFHKVLVERVEPEREEKITLKKMFSAVFKNKYLLIFYIALILTQITNTAQIVLTYLAKFCLGSDAFTTPLLLCIYIPMILFTVFMPALMKKIDKFVMLYICVAGCLVTGIITYFVGYSNFTALLIITFIRGIFYGPMAILLYVFTVDIVEYGHFRTGERVEGLAFSFQTFSAKVVNGLTAGVGMAIMGMFGFVEGADAVQSATAINGIWLLFTLIPSIGFVIGLIVFSFYKLRDKDVQIMTKANMGEITREEALSQISPKIKL